MRPRIPMRGGGGRGGRIDVRPGLISTKSQKSVCKTFLDNNLTCENLFQKKKSNSNHLTQKIFLDPDI